MMADWLKDVVSGLRGSGTKSRKHRLISKAVLRDTQSLEPRLVLSVQALGGYAFSTGDFHQIANFDVRGISQMPTGNIIVFGGDSAGHGRAVELDLVDGVFQNVNEWIFKSPYEQANPGATSYANVKGVYMGATEPVFAVEGAVSADTLDYRAFLYSGSSYTQADIGVNGQVRIIGVTADHRVLIDSGVSVIYQDGQVTPLDDALGAFPKGSTVSVVGSSYGGYVDAGNFQPRAQLWNAAGQALVTDFGSSTYSFQRFTRLSESSNGLVGTAEVYDSESNFGEVLISASPMQGGFSVTTLSPLYGEGSIHATTQIGSSVYYVTDAPGVANDGAIRIAGSTDTIAFADLFPSLADIQDLVVNELSFDATNRIWFVQGYSEKATGRESWVLSLSVTPEIPAKPSPNFQNLPLQSNAPKTISWTPVDGAAQYVVQINNLGTKTVERKVTVAVHQLDVTLANAGRYAIWVQAVGATGKAGPWSDVTTFLVVDRPPVIEYSEGTFTWTNLDASSYRLWVNNSQGQKIVEQTTSAVSFQQALSAGSYTAWVKPDGLSWSSPYQFTLFHDAITVTPLTTLDQTPTISWAGPADGSYDVFVALKNAPTTAVYRQTVTGNSVTLPPRARGTYTVWVRQQFPDGSVTRWGIGATLVIAERPVLSLADSMLSWTAYADAAQYELWVSTAASTDRLAVSPEFVSGTSLDLSTLSGVSSGSYRIWIRAVSDGSTGLFATSLWSYATAFTV